MRICPICLLISKNNLKKIIDIDLKLVNNIKLNNNLSIKLCKDCNFYFSDSNNTQEDYNTYYKTFNNYINQNYCINKDDKCAQFLNNNINMKDINTILDYGSGNGALANLLSNKFNIDKYDIGMELLNNKYDCVILSHVLEHIYDLNVFINTVSKNIKDNGLLYIEIPNADFYDKFINICPLQEINIEHINFFSKYALNKLLINNGFYCIEMCDDYFVLNTSNYYVIRGIFKKFINNYSFEKYISNGLEIINSFKFNKLKNMNIYIYGCGQFLFKIIDKIQNICNVINVIDDNPCYSNLKINNIDIINYESFKKKYKLGDNILLTTMIHNQIIKDKLLLINKNINIIELSNL